MTYEADTQPTGAETPRSALSSSRSEPELSRRGEHTLREAIMRRTYGLRKGDAPAAHNELQRANKAVEDWIRMRSFAARRGQQSADALTGT